MNDGLNELTMSFRKLVDGSTPKDLIIDFGTIKDDFSLVCDTFSEPIPPDDYLVCRSLTWGAKESIITTTSADGEHNHEVGGATTSTDGSHNHDVLLPEKMRSLTAGDRVLVAWVGRGLAPDAVVIDIIMPAKEAMNNG